MGHAGERRHVVGLLERELGWACAPRCVCWDGRVRTGVHVVSLTPSAAFALRASYSPVGGPPHESRRGDLCMGAVSVCGPSCVVRVRVRVLIPSRCEYRT